MYRRDENAPLRNVANVNIAGASGLKLDAKPSQPIIIEQRKRRQSGEAYIKSFVKGRFLGKVRFTQRASRIMAQPRTLDPFSGWIRQVLRA